MARPQLVAFETFTDERGQLMVAECGKEIPFSVERAFWITNVPEGTVRGEHAHRRCHQMLVAMHGSFQVDVWTTEPVRSAFRLSHPHFGLIIPAMHWITVRGIAQEHSQDGVLVVFASQLYDPQDYIVDWEEFCAQGQS